MAANHYTNGSGDDVELLAVDSPLKLSNHSRRSGRVDGVLRLLSSNDDEEEDDALLLLERDLTQGLLFVTDLLYNCCRFAVL